MKICSFYIVNTWEWNIDNHRKEWCTLGFLAAEAYLSFNCLFYKVLRKCTRGDLSMMYMYIHSHFTVIGWVIAEIGLIISIVSSDRPHARQDTQQVGGEHTVQTLILYSLHWISSVTGKWSGSKSYICTPRLTAVHTFAVMLLNKLLKRQLLFWLDFYIL